ncbi:MAG: M20 family metallopeptidase [Anaerolineaceae bacterium]|nr:M20 family metallopeptidase [Anaerolineaceae bacterium]MDE0329053.1 M20 family metallopeptidase [Anaerolineaceae bacterium]
MSELLRWCEARRQAMVDELDELVRLETPTTDKAAVDRCGRILQARLEALGASVARHPQEQVGDMLLASWHADAPGPAILFLTHTDTVWPLGTLAERPPRIDDEGRFLGPGAIDMKGGIVIVLTAIRALVERGELPRRPLRVLVTSDEELGSRHSEQLIMDTAADCGLVLVMEPATKEGALKTWRKGVATYELLAEGRASHAGNAPEQGINAIVEMAQQIGALNEMNDLQRGTSVSVTVVEGGITTNVIPPRATARVDVRTLSVRALEEVDEAILALQPRVPGARLTVTRHHRRAPMERDERMIAAFNQARAIGAALGLTVREYGSGGGSDGNFTAAAGITTLDGLGPQGDGLHAEHEHVIINSLPQRAALVAGMLRDWQFPTP